ncbi:MAG TPA: AAA family ATPase [Pyrinomonadaceae bacterium]|nr:AAA family ATPase [Pyrinomonadaceae bacterium]
MDISSQEPAEPSLDAIFTIRTANEWMRTAAKRKAPNKLFGEYWREGELAILFSDAGAGKSLLAVQIAESIARSHSVGPVENTARPQNVLYLDFELSEKQFEMRYTGEKGGHYKFSERFHRVEANVSQAEPDQLFPAMTRLVEKTKAKVLIIDNISYLKRTYDGGRDQIELIKQLRQLKNEHGLSILVLAHSARRNTSLPIEFGDLCGARMLGNFADSIFAIGRCATSMASRYIKPIKHRSDVAAFNNIPSFRIRKIYGKFLGFDYDRTATESAHINDVPDREDDELTARIEEMSATGFSVRAIAAELGLSKSSVHRLLSDARRSEETLYDAEEYDPKTHPGYFPGREEYDAAIAAVQQEAAYFDKNEEGWLLGRKHYLIELACADAKREYERSGVAPRLVEHPKYAEFLKEVEGLRATFEDPLTTETQRRGEEEDDGGEQQSVPEAVATGEVYPAIPIPEIRHEHYTINGVTDDPRHPGLVSVTDVYGKELFVEEFWYDGRPSVWCQYDNKGIKHRWTRGTWGCTGETVEDP